MAKDEIINEHNEHIFRHIIDLGLYTYNFFC